MTSSSTCTHYVHDLAYSLYDFSVDGKKITEASVQVVRATGGVCQRGRHHYASGFAPCAGRDECACGWQAGQLHPVEPCDYAALSITRAGPPK